MYADDTHQTYADIIHSCLNEDLLNISRWLISNKLTLNMAKTEFMLIGSGQKLNACNRGNCNSRMRLSWPFIHSLGSLSNCRRWRRQQQCQKTIHRFYEQNNCSARVSRFLVHFFDVHCTTTTWNLPTRRFIEDLRVEMVQKISLLYLNMDKALENLTPGKVTHIWRIERFQIDVIKFKRRKFVFFFLWCFHCRRRRRCLRSLLPAVVSVVRAESEGKKEKGAQRGHSRKVPCVAASLRML